MSAVSTPSLLGRLIDLNVLDDQVAGVETLGVGIGLCVLEEAEENLSRLDRPTGPGDAKGLAYGKSAIVHAILPIFAALPSSHGKLFLDTLPSACFYMLDPQKSLTLCGASSAAGIPPHGNRLLVLQNISKICESTLKFPAVDSLRRLAGVLEGNAEVAAAGAGRLCAVDAGCSVANLPELAPMNFIDEYECLKRVASAYHCVVWCCVVSAN